MDETVTDRVRTVMDATSASQSAFAARIGLTADKLSKSLNGTRRFTSLDLARIAEAGSTTTDWLLTGRRPGPHRAAARTRTATSPGATAALEDQVNRFTNAYEVLRLLDRLPALPELPALRTGLGRAVDEGEALAQDTRSALAAHGAPAVPDLETADLIRLLGDLLGIDVAQVALPGGFDGVAWQSDTFRLVLLNRTPVWTRQRFTLAHELGHILAGDAQDLLTESHLAPGRQKDLTEIRANVFAANLLMPAENLRATVAGDRPVGDWNSQVVRFKVSPSALAARLHHLGLIPGAERDRIRALTTERCHLRAQRMDVHQQRSTASAAELPAFRPAAGLYGAYLDGDTTLRPLAAHLGMDAESLREALEPDPAPDSPHTTGGTSRDCDEKGDLLFQP